MTRMWRVLEEEEQMNGAANVFNNYEGTAQTNDFSGEGKKKKKRGEMKQSDCSVEYYSITE